MRFHATHSQPPPRLPDWWDSVYYESVVATLRLAASEDRDAPISGLAARHLLFKLDGSYMPRAALAQDAEQKEPPPWTTLHDGVLDHIDAVAEARRLAQDAEQETA